VCRVAVVTGGNKGIGLQVCRQLASKGVVVVLTARDEERGTEAARGLQASGFSDVVYHNLDVSDPSSAACLADFIQNKFGKLDILVSSIPPPTLSFFLRKKPFSNIYSGNYLDAEVRHVLCFPKEICCLYS
jgi:NAD(P)-dependent dehydrogenase (short-subunit alcohol dehydrogenase family)